MRYAILILFAALGGCATLELPDGTKIKGETPIMQYYAAMAVRDAVGAAGICQSAPVEVIATLSASGQAEYYRAAGQCHTALLVAAARDNALSPQGEVALASSRSIQAAEQSEASVIGSVARATGWLGVGYIMGEALSDVASQRGDTYTVGNIEQSSSRHIDGIGGAEGGSVSSTSNGASTSSIHIGPGDSSTAVIDSSPSSVLQPNQGGVDKPQAVDATGPFTNNDDDGGNEASVLGF